MFRTVFKRLSFPVYAIGLCCVGCGSHDTHGTDAQAVETQTPVIAVHTSPSQAPAPAGTPAPSASAAPVPGGHPTPAPTPTPQSPPAGTPTPTPTPTTTSPSQPGNLPPPPTGTPISGGTPSASVPWASLDFVDNPGGRDSKAVALTFDDGPDGQSGYGGTNNTAYILDQLKALNLQATFFLCDHVWTEVQTDPLAQQDIQRMISEGHDVANHTFDHNNLSEITPAQVDAEFAQNANAMAIPQALGPAFQMTMYRVPFGVPYQDNTADVARIAPITAKYGVHIGWGIDTNDWDCAQAGLDANCILDNLNAQLDKGHAGVILMHAVYKITGDALPAIVKTINAHGLHIVSVEDLIQDKYGMTSAQLSSANVNASFASTSIAAAAQNACSGNDFDIDPPFPAPTQVHE